MPAMDKARESMKIVSPVMAKNNEIAKGNRRFFQEHGIFCLNIIGSPGSGKTTLLEAMAKHLRDSMAVIEGDVQTRRDAERVEKAGCRVHQIETGGACHLDAQAVAQALEHLDIEQGNCPILVIENVGNLICPSSFDLGENLKAGLLSVAEGDDKILKYPSLFSRISALIINKVDLLPYLDFDVDRVVEECKSLNDHFRAFQLSAKTGEGVETFCRFLQERMPANAT